MKLWEKLEEWLFDNEKTKFSNGDLADALNLSKPEASQMIQSYLSAQRAMKAKTLYVLKRQGRTKHAVWSVGLRKADGQIIADTFLDDLRVKANRAFVPDVKRFGVRSPRNSAWSQQTVEAVLGGAFVVLQAATHLENSKK